ncbi:hypothetical protein T4E_3620 [Trichinella pseudospiralis]|uniref:Uncharacterized protein n=1 Tax=Trichinella pseudospiralis TaxID=6337 RepID=A0A0V1FH31_TRIPS|nr:hypothetical protein T4E_3620 [Trichinella pseudospiralis]KRY85121.1 hypothetical protein T4D_3699 [Trichinella pseudospiralis]
MLHVESVFTKRRRGGVEDDGSTMPKPSDDRSSSSLRHFWANMATNKQAVPFFRLEASIG